jgi:N-acetylglucosaminyldiphosphoundecaprenol N-acetyl-beta-D-mannosaminyltransferase
MPEGTRPHTCVRPTDGPRVGGVRIDVLTWPSFLERLESFLACGRGHVLHYLAADPTVTARSRPAYRDLLNRGDLNLADGMPVAWATKLFGSPTERISGIDCMWRVAEWGLGRDLGHFYYGGTEEVAAATPRAISGRFPDLEVRGAESPPFFSLSEWREAGLGDVAARVRATGARALWVGLGAPKQDVVGDRLASLDTAPLVFCVGGAFEVVGGARPATPEWMRRGGLEWAHRLVSEPGRLWRRYLVGNPKFVAGVARDLRRERSRAAGPR